MTELDNLYFLNIHSNQFTFDDIIPTIEHITSNVSSYNYAPQDSIYKDTTITLNEGETFLIDLGIDNGISDNKYVWYKDGVKIDSSNSNTYTINSVIVENSGIYTCKVTNPGAPDLTLYSRSDTLVVNRICSVPNVIGTTSICIGASAVLSVVQPHQYDSIIWYNDASLSSIAYNGSAFITNPLSSATTFWVVGIVDSCESEPASITVSVSAPQPRKLMNVLVELDSVRWNLWCADLDTLGNCVGVEPRFRFRLGVDGQNMSTYRHLGSEYSPDGLMILNEQSNTDGASVSDATGNFNYSFEFSSSCACQVTFDLEAWEGDATRISLCEEEDYTFIDDYSFPCSLVDEGDDFRASTIINYNIPAFSNSSQKIINFGAFETYWNFQTVIVEAPTIHPTNPSVCPNETLLLNASISDSSNFIRWFRDQSNPDGTLLFEGFNYNYTNSTTFPDTIYAAEYNNNCYGELQTVVVKLSSSCSEPFITTWLTTMPNESITIPTDSVFYNYNYEVNWGDGNITSNHAGDASHIYTNSGSYSISISGDFPKINFNYEGDKEKIVSIDQWGDIQWESMQNAFSDAQTLLMQQ
ncbi:MAG: immunoglobulin domain-containing protein [Chitinophagales bacterium]